MTRAQPAAGTKPRTLAATVRQRPVLAIGVALMMTALVATLSNSPGRYVADNRFEQFWAPGGRILRETALWDGRRGLGRVAEEFWPSTLPIGFLRAIGFSPDIVERIWHAALLVLAGVALVHLLRVFQPEVGVLHAVAAFAYAFNPFTAVFLLPSVLFWNYAIAPIVVLALLRGLERPSSWRWPAVLALAVFLAGNADLPGTAYVLLLLVPTALYAVVIDRSVSWRDVGSVLARAALLGLLCSAAALTKAVFGATSLEARLAATELPRRVSSASSWSESWRGLGFWLSYFGSADDIGRLPGGRYYWESVAGVIVTFLAPIAALIAVAWSRWRPRWLFVGFALTSLVLMVGSYPSENPSPLGRGILWVFENVSALASMRNTYKAGAGLAMATAVLLGLFTVTAGRHLRSRARAWRFVPMVAAGLIVSAQALPFLNGGLYPADGQLDEVPDYWNEAFEYIDSQPGTGRVLVLPGTTKTAYRWGWPGDDIFDANLRRHPNVIATAFPLSTPLVASAIDALDDQVTAGTIEPGTIASVARRLGITQVILRNDLDWDRSQVARPQVLETIRQDPSLVLAASFGAAGENVVDPDDDSVAARFEVALPPVEVYDVTGATGSGLGRAALEPAIVAGDGAALAMIGAAGAVEDGRPVRFSGEIEGDALLAAATGGGPVVITDSNRRQVVRIRGAVPTRSETLGPGQSIDQEPGDLWKREGSQTVAVFADATRISATSSGTRLVGYQPWLRPANAFDGNPASVWLTGGLEDPVGNRIRIDFSQPVELSSIDLEPYRPSDGGRAVSAVRLHFSTGDPVIVFLDPERPTIPRFSARRTDLLELEILAVSRAGEAAVGFREIRIPGLDLAERIQVPDDLFRIADEDPELATALAAAPTTYLFERRTGRGDVDEELILRRRFRSIQEGPTVVTGSLSLDPDLSDREVSEALAVLSGSEVIASGSSRYQGELIHRGAQAADGDLSTAWGTRPEEGEALTMRFPVQRVDEIRVVALDDGATELQSVVVTVAGRTEEIDVERGIACGDQCRGSAVVTLADPVEADRVEVRVGRVGPGTGLPIRIAEVEVDGPEGVVDPASSDRRVCATGFLAVDGVDVPIRLTDARPRAIAEGAPATIAACDPPDLAAGDHEVDGRLLNRLAIGFDADSATPPRGTDPRVEVLEQSPDHLRVRVESPESAWISTGQSYHPDWTAAADGEDLGPPVPIDGQAAWLVPEGDHDIVMAFGPARYYRMALVTTVLAVIICTVLALAPRRRGST